MTTIMIPGSDFEGIGALNAAPPDAVSITKLERHPSDKPGVRRVHVLFPNGFTMFTFVHFAHEQDSSGNFVRIPNLPDNKFIGRMKAIKTILYSLGYADEQIQSGDIHDGWFITAQSNNKGFVDFTPGQRGVQGSYSNVNSWLTKAQYESRKSQPAAAQTKASPAAVKVGAAPLPAAKQTMSAPAPTNGAGAPSVGAALPPPPSVAQGIVS